MITFKEFQKEIMVDDSGAYITPDIFENLTKRVYELYVEKEKLDKQIVSLEYDIETLKSMT